MKFDKRLTLEELENVILGEPAVDSYVVSSCHALRKSRWKTSQGKIYVL